MRDECRGGGATNGDGRIARTGGGFHGILDLVEMSLWTEDGNLTVKVPLAHGNIDALGIISSNKGAEDGEIGRQRRWEEHRKKKKSTVFVVLPLQGEEKYRSRGGRFAVRGEGKLVHISRQYVIFKVARVESNEWFECG